VIALHHHKSIVSDDYAAGAITDHVSKTAARSAGVDGVDAQDLKTDFLTGSLDTSEHRRLRRTRRIRKYRNLRQLGLYD
jgi:hypothetical protein